jgi:predicted Zn-dependent peptidase
MKYIQTDKFTDNCIVVRSLLPLKKESITAYNMLIYLIRSRTEKLPTKVEFSTALNEAYGLKTAFGLSGYGSCVCLDMRISYIRSDYIDEKDYLDQVLFLIDQILMHPLLDEANFEEAKYLYSERLARQFDDPDSLAILSALQLVDEKYPLSIAVQGNIDDVKKITYEDLCNAYEDVKQAKKMICACGAIEEPVLDYLKNLEGESKPEIKRTLVEPSNFKNENVERHISQTSLVQIYATSTDISDPLYYPLLVANTMLGAGPMNLLFEEIREKHSYCYSISSSLLRFDGAMLICCGTQKKYVAHVEELIAKQIERLATGDFSEEDLNIAKMDMIDMIQSQADRAMGMIEQYFFDEMLGRINSTPQSRIDQVQSVSKEQIRTVMSRMQKIVQVCVSQEGEEE